VSCSSILGGIIIVAIGAENESTLHATTYLLPFASGLFLYLALASLLPELYNTHDTKRLARSFVWFSVGVGLMALLLLMPHSHGHDEHEEEEPGV